MGVVETIIAIVSVVASLTSIGLSLYFNSLSNKSSNQSLNNINVTQCSEGNLIPKSYGIVGLKGNIDFYKSFKTKAKYKHTKYYVYVYSFRLILTENISEILNVKVNNSEFNFNALNREYNYGSIFVNKGDGTSPIRWKTCGNKYGRIGTNEWNHPNLQYKHLTWVYFAYLIQMPGESSVPDFAFIIKNHYESIYPALSWNLLDTIGENPFLIIASILDDVNKKYNLDNFLENTEICRQYRIGLNLSFTSQTNYLDVLKDIFQKIQFIFFYKNNEFVASPLFGDKITQYFNYKVTKDLNMSFESMNYINYNFIYGRQGIEEKTKSFIYNQENTYNFNFIGYKEIPNIIMNYIINKNSNNSVVVNFTISIYDDNINIGEIFQFFLYNIEKTVILLLINKQYDFVNQTIQYNCVIVNELTNDYTDEEGGTSIEQYTKKELKQIDNVITINIDKNLFNIFFYPYYNDNYYNFNYNLYLNNNYYLDDINFAYKSTLNNNINFLDVFDDNVNHKVYIAKNNELFETIDFIEYYNIFDSNAILLIGNEIFFIGKIEEENNNIVITNFLRLFPKNHIIGESAYLVFLDKQIIFSDIENTLEYELYYNDDFFNQNFILDYTISEETIKRTFFFFTYQNELEFFIYDFDVTMNSEILKEEYELNFRLIIDNIVYEKNYIKNIDFSISHVIIIQYKNFIIEKNFSNLKESHFYDFIS